MVFFHDVQGFSKSQVWETNAELLAVAQDTIENVEVEIGDNPKTKKDKKEKKEKKEKKDLCACDICDICDSHIINGPKKQHGLPGQDLQEKKGKRSSGEAGLGWSHSPCEINPNVGP